MQSEQPLSLKRQAYAQLKWNRKIESCLSDYENVPGGLATFGGFFCDYLATMETTMACDYRLCSALLAALGLPRSRCREFLKRPPQIAWERGAECTMNASHHRQYKRRKCAR
nr:MAG TPA: hypothetical protein [Caudoviricetes sp.]